MTKNELPTETEENFPEPHRTDIHECLVAASAAPAETKTSNPMIVFSIRLPKETKDQAHFICERNATELGAYLRECTRALLRDYGVKSAEE